MQWNTFNCVHWSHNINSVAILFHSCLFAKIMPVLVVNGIDRGCDETLNTDNIHAEAPHTSYTHTYIEPEKLNNN